MPVTINGDGSITGLSVGGLPNGTVDADTLASGLATQGLQEVDQWRLSANKQLSTSWNDITADLERADNTFSTHVGTGMSQSSGVFTFPSTGKWLIQANGYLYSSDQEMHYGQIRTVVSSDSGSNYTIVGYEVGNATSGGSLTQARQWLVGCSNGTRGLYMGGVAGNGSVEYNIIGYLTCATPDGNARVA